MSSSPMLIYLAVGKSSSATCIHSRYFRLHVKRPSLVLSRSMSPLVEFSFRASSRAAAFFRVWAPASTKRSATPLP